MALTRGGAA
uniref:Uncharacterized protein n=1 Tax=Setaria italica TaxID=4555 RepID=A0A0Q3RHE8_SETIT